VCIVSSGAVGMGCQVMRLRKRPTTLAHKQALAAIGQGALLRMYTDLFSAVHLVCVALVDVDRHAAAW
jgi:glutamate 5-kinase